MIKNSITAIVLAGGQSSRFGEDKALIRLKNQPLLRQICDLASDYATLVYIITPWPERYRGILPQEYHLLPEEKPNNGPLIGFVQALAQVKTEWCLLLACDLPKLTKVELDNWLNHWRELNQEVMALLPKNSKGWDPLAGFYRSSSLPLLEEYIAQGGRSFQSWLSHQAVAELPLTNPQALFNCNTKQDLIRLKSLDEF
jgi:molybdopterin-guanine dinucleotide biosynthesis protein A